ncbi:MAG: TetR/AcrR family transcriptional regulator [Acetanaerobacterium sp.]
MPSTEKNNEKTRKEILDKTAQLFLARGYKKTSIREIAEATGMLKGNLYYYFRKKEDILLVLFQDSIKVLYSELQKIIGNVDPLICHAIMVRTYLRILDENRGLLKIYVEASQVPVLRQAFFDILNHVFNDVIQNSSYTFDDTMLYLSTISSASVEMEMVSQYEQEYFSMEDIISTVVRVKLSLLNIEPRRIDDIIKASLSYKLNI